MLIESAAFSEFGRLAFKISQFAGGVLSDHPPLFTSWSPKNTTEGLLVQGGAPRHLGGRDDIRSQSTTIERWIPPSAIKRDALPENNDDVKFRKVRGILNKLTPQTFDRLSDELIRIGLDSQVLLKGVILLIFEKALQEPKYVCMYGQLCKKLSKKVPNFDPPNPEYTTTFRRLLLCKCQDEYENRARASASFDHRPDRLTPEEEEEKQLAKRKMLGNIKFIGELGKLEMLTHSILHKCCEELVKKTKAEDLECLCQIMSTCGHLLDNDKGKYLMNQYFCRMRELSTNDKFPSRIRFMLQDVLELRENHWLPRQTTSLKESPKPINDIRREAHDELGISDPQRNDDFRYIQFGDPRRNRFFSKKTRTGMEDVFAPAPLMVTSLGTGPGVISLGDKPLGHENNGYHGNPLTGYRPSGGIRNYNNGNSMNHTFFPGNKGHFNGPDSGGFRGVGNGYENNKAAVAPRFKKQGNGNGGSEEPSLRPPPHSMIKMIPMKPPFMEKILPGLPIQMPKETPLISSAKSTIEKMKPKKEKPNGPSKEEILKRVEEVLVDENGDFLTVFTDLKAPEKVHGEVVRVILTKSLEGTEEDREKHMDLLRELVERELLGRGAVLDGFRALLEEMSDLEVNFPRVKSHVASCGARAVTNATLSLAQLAETTEGGAHFPFLLILLQQLGKTLEKEKLAKIFDDSKINLLNTLPKSDRTKDRLREILEERELSFLFPLLKIQAEMLKELEANCDPDRFFEWIKENVKEEYQETPGFISALFTVIFRHVSLEVGKNPAEEEKEKEKNLLLNFKKIINEFLLDRVDLQIIAIYALQAAWFALDAPKAMLLRWFVHLYELEMIEEEAFLKWKEDIRDEYPGKGKALFQVNQWLLWLEEADEEEEEDEEGDEEPDN